MCIGTGVDACVCVDGSNEDGGGDGIVGERAIVALEGCKGADRAGRALAAASGGLSEGARSVRR